MMQRPEVRFATGMSIAMTLFLWSAIIGALGDSLAIQLGVFLVLITTVLTSVRNITKLVTTGFLFSLGFLFVAFYTNDAVAILEVSIAFVVIMISFLAVKYNFPYYVKELISGMGVTSFNIADFVDTVEHIPTVVRITISRFVNRIGEIRYDRRVGISNTKYLLSDFVQSVRVAWANFRARFRWIFLFIRAKKLTKSGTHLARVTFLAVITVVRTVASVFRE